MTDETVIDWPINWGPGRYEQRDGSGNIHQIVYAGAQYTGPIRLNRRREIEQFVADATEVLERWDELTGGHS